MVVFVTGGTGFLGQALIRHLRSRGKEVRALIRTGSDTRALDLERLEVALGDVRDASSLRSGMAGCRAVVHAAALTDPAAKRRDLEAANVAGFRNVMDAAYRHKVRIVIHVSSFLALGPTGGAIADEAYRHPPRKTQTELERSLAAADRLTGPYVSGGLPLCVVYPTLAYGPGPVTVGNVVSQLIIRRAMGRFGTVPSSDETRWCLAYVEDIAEGVCKALERGAPGDRFLLGGETLPLLQVFQLLEDVSGLAVPRRKRSLAGTGARARFAEWGSRLVGRDRPPTRLALELMRHDWAYSSDRAVERLGYTIHPLKDGLRRTVDYLARKRHIS